MDQRHPHVVETRSGDLALKAHAALVHLAESHAYALDAQCDPWEFAVELPRLTSLGLSVNDLRWLVKKGYATHAREITEPGDAARKFAVGQNTVFSEDTCFLPTDAGLLFAGFGQKSPTILRLADGASQGTAENAARPHWDGAGRILYLGKHVVKRYERRSPNQEIVLAAFQEEGWPRRIDDPLPPLGDVAPKCRLHDTIKWLNRNQESHLLRFSGDGTGEGICWAAAEAGALPMSAKVSRKAA